MSSYPYELKGCPCVDIIGDPFEDNKRLKEMNAKLELKLLNENIKANLPKLNALARRVENDAWSLDNAMSAKPGALPPSSDICKMLLKSKDELIKDISEYISKRDRLQAQVAADKEQYRSQQIHLSREIAALRRDINDLTHECVSYKRSAWKYRLSSIEEESRLDYLVQQLETTKSEIGRYHIEKDGWITQAFLLETNNDLQAEISKERLKDIVNLWLPHVNGNVETALALCPHPFPKDPSSLSYDHFVALCKILETEDS